MNEYTHCPRCNRTESLAVAEDALHVNAGPEGPLHTIGCTKCGWNRPSTHYKGIDRKVLLREILNPPLAKLEEGIRRFS
jgi:hypothetical protein